MTILSLLNVEFSIQSIASSGNAVGFVVDADHQAVDAYFTSRPHLYSEVSLCLHPRFHQLRFLFGNICCDNSVFFIISY